MLKELGEAQAMDTVLAKRGALYGALLGELLGAGVVERAANVAATPGIFFVKGRATTIDL